MPRSSLAESAESSSGSSGGGAAMEPKKIAIIAVCVVAILGSVGFVLYNMGIIGGTEQPTTPTYYETLSPEQKAEFEKIEKERERLEKIYPPSGA